MQNETLPAADAITNPTIVGPNEAQLINEVHSLWDMHIQGQTSLRKNREELRSVRADLSLRLHVLKAVLSRPGRAGAWSSFLNAHMIPRSSADRLVRAHEKALSAEGNNRSSEHIVEALEITVQKYVHALWPKLSRILTTPALVELFISELTCRVNKSFSRVTP